MASPSSSDEIESTPEANKITNELNFSSIFSESRERGDGDSITEFKEETHKSTNKEYETIKEMLPNVTSDAKCKKSKRPSKIPVRQVKPTQIEKDHFYENRISSVTDVRNEDKSDVGRERKTEAGCDNISEARTHNDQVPDNLTSLTCELDKGMEHNSIWSKQERCGLRQHAGEGINGIQIGFVLSAAKQAVKTNHPEITSEDLPDIFNDLSSFEVIYKDSIHTAAFCSLTPSDPLVAVEESDTPVILEAPEEFLDNPCSDNECFDARITEQVVDSEPEDPPDCDRVDAVSAETGDTSERLTDKDECCRETSPSDRVKEPAHSTAGSGGEVVEDNAAAEIVTPSHVGWTAPSQENNDTSRINASMVANGSVGVCAGKGCKKDEGTVEEAMPDTCVRVEQTPRSEALSVEPSIEIGVAQCAKAPGCSRLATAKVYAARDGYCERSKTTSCPVCDTNPEKSTNNPASKDSEKKCSAGNVSLSDVNKEKCKTEKINNLKEGKNLKWSFKNGRLVFEVVENDGDESKSVPDIGLGSRLPSSANNEQVVDALSKQSDYKLNGTGNIGSVNDILCSKTLNKRIDESRSRLKYLEEKLKKAGITDDETLITNKPKYVEFSQYNNKTELNNELKCDANHNIVENNSTPNKDLSDDDEEEVIPSEDTVDFAGNFCEFDVRKVGAFSGLTNYCQVYDELDDETSSDCSDEECCHNLIKKPCGMRGDSTNMGTDSERAKHNPDRDNLKSLLKKPGKGKDRKSNRVVFNENKNEFFDADYIILIREECDYDDEEDEGVCTCNQHEMVRLTCCEPNCNCGGYDGFDQTPQSPKFAPPIEFVDAVTLSPPDEYKDMELREQQLYALQQIARRGQKAAVCKDCIASREDDEDEGETSLSDSEVVPNENLGEHHKQEEQEEKEKTDQSQQTTPTTPPNDFDSPSNNQRYILETITMTSVTEQKILREIEDEHPSPCPSPLLPPGGSPISGILKGGKLWKQQSLDVNTVKPTEPLQNTDSGIISDEENSSRRSVRFIESDQEPRDVCDGAPDNRLQEEDKADRNEEEEIKENCNMSVSPESTEMMLTFKLGNHVLISNNSLKPNSAVRQLFPCTKPNGKTGEEESVHQYLVTAESLRAFEEAKRSKLPQIIQSGETDESIKRAIERNTLRRSLIRYEPRNKKNTQKTDNSLVERIKQLTCDVDEIIQDTVPEEIPPRASPTGEEARNSPDVNQPINKNHDKSFSPSSSSTTSSNSSSMSSTYRKITDLFAKRERVPFPGDAKLVQTLPDIGGPPNHEPDISQSAVVKVNSTNESRKQFLSTLAPLTACVSGMGTTDEFYYQMSNHADERNSVASSVGTEYSLEDIDEGLKNGDEEVKRIAPDVLAGTPSASESGDELAMFVQQDAGRIERIKKKYQPEQLQNKDDDDEHDDYGFNRRPTVRGIKPRFGSTTEILQQIQNQLQPPIQPTRVAWPYYSESGLTPADNCKAKNINQNQNYQYANVQDDLKNRSYAPAYRPTSLQEENLYQNCTNQRCREMYRSNTNVYSPVLRVGGGCTEYHHTSLPRTRNGRPLSPPPLELSKTYHQTMVYIPYNHIEGYQTIPPNPCYQSNADYSRVSNQNQINKRYIEPPPVYQQRVHAGNMEEHHYTSNVLPPKTMVRVPYVNGQPMMTSRSESPLPGQFSTARSTQTPAATLSTCTYYPRYRPMVGPMWQGEANYVKVNRHSFPMGAPRYSGDNISLTDSDSQHSGQMPNGYRLPIELPQYIMSQKESMPNSPTKPARFIERGVPEGAASVSPQDTGNMVAQNSSTMTSPTSPQNPPPPISQKPLFYAMNV